jgi:hypothetical protein
LQFSAQFLHPPPSDEQQQVHSLFPHFSQVPSPFEALLADSILSDKELVRIRYRVRYGNINLFEWWVWLGCSPIEKLFLKNDFWLMLKKLIKTYHVYFALRSSSKMFQPFLMLNCEFSHPNCLTRNRADSKASSPVSDDESLWWLKSCQWFVGIRASLDSHGSQSNRIWARTDLPSSNFLFLKIPQRASERPRLKGRYQNSCSGDSRQIIQ